MKYKKKVSRDNSNIDVNEAMHNACLENRLVDTDNQMLLGTRWTRNGIVCSYSARE